MRRPGILWTLTALLALSFLPGCIPRASSVEPPTFRPLPESFTLVQLEPPGVGSGRAMFRLELSVGNPNTFALSLSRLDFTLFINGRRAAQGSSNEAVNLPPNGSERLTLNITVALGEVPEVLGDMARLVAGEPTPYRLEGAATASAFGLSRRYAGVTLAEGLVEPPAALTAPGFRLLPSGLRELNLSRAVVAVGLELDNPTPFGYVLSAPAVTLNLDGRNVATASVTAQPVPAFSSTTLNLTFELRPTTLGVTLFEKLAGLSNSGGLELELSGDVALELPGMFRRNFSLDLLPEVLK